MKDNDVNTFKLHTIAYLPISYKLTRMDILHTVVNKVLVSVSLDTLVINKICTSFIWYQRPLCWSYFFEVISMSFWGDWSHIGGHTCVKWPRFFLINWSYLSHDLILMTPMLKWSLVWSHFEVMSHFGGHAWVITSSVFWTWSRLFRSLSLIWYKWLQC